jgi:hypothetical protein
MAHPYKHMAQGGQACAKARYADGGDVSSFVKPGYGGVAEQLADRADVEKTGVNVGMRVGADEESNPQEPTSKSLARFRMRKGQ